MYTRIEKIGARDFVLREAPALAGSMVLAELLYKFHSFTLECLAFLVTWYALSRFQAMVTGRMSRRRR